jgi:hypothetical protein
MTNLRRQLMVAQILLNIIPRASGDKRISYISHHILGAAFVGYARISFSLVAAIVTSSDILRST